MKQQCKQHINEKIRLKYYYMGYKFDVVGIILGCNKESITFNIMALNKLKTIEYTNIDKIEKL